MCRAAKTPFKEKTPLYYFESDIEENAENNKTSETVNLISDIGREQDKLNDIINIDDKNKQFIIVSMIVDKMSDVKKISLLKKVIYNYQETNGKFNHPILSLLFQYFQDLFLYKYKDLEPLKKSNNKKDKLIGFYYIITDEGKKPYLKTYCYNYETKLISECQSELRERIKTQLKIKFKKELSSQKYSLHKIYGFMIRKNGSYVFKIYDGTKEKGELTLTMEKSKRSEIRGKQCSHHNIDELKNIVKKLNMENGKISKKTVCFKIEFLLRKNNYYKKENEIWFLDALDFMKTKIK